MAVARLSRNRGDARGAGRDGRGAGSQEAALGERGIDRHGAGRLRAEALVRHASSAVEMAGRLRR